MCFRCPGNHSLRLQWVHECALSGKEFSDDSRFNLSYSDGSIRVRCYRSEHNMAACIVEQHSGQTPSVMVRSAIGSTCDLTYYVLRAI